MSLLSVIIPMRNAEPYIGGALDSVLSQKDIELEVVIIDDGSTDRSVQIVEQINDPRVRIVRGPRKGIAAAFNAGLAAARGDLIARCDADDVYPPDRLAWQRKFLDDHPEFGAVCGSYSTITEKGAVIAERHYDEPAEEITNELCMGIGRSHMCAYAFRTSILRQIGGCREWFTTSEDADLQYRLSEVARVWYEPRTSYLYRLHAVSITHTQRSAERAFYRTMAQKFQEQRRTGGTDDLERGKPPELKLLSSEESDPHTPRDHIQNLLVGRSWREHAAGKKLRAMTTGLRACFAKPLNLSAWRSLLALMFKRAGNENGGRMRAS